MSKHLQCNGARGFLSDPRKNDFAQLSKQRNAKPQQAIAHQQRNRHSHKRSRVRTTHIQGVDDFFEQQWYANVGKLGCNQAAQRKDHAPAPGPQIGQQARHRVPIALCGWGGVAGRALGGRRRSRMRAHGRLREL
jgi:hypothetical protein